MRAHRRRTMAAKYLTVAEVAAPHVRKILQQQELRDDLRALIASARQVYGDLAHSESGPTKQRSSWREAIVGKSEEPAADAAEQPATEETKPKPRRKWRRRLLVFSALGGAVALLNRRKRGGDSSEHV